MTREVINILYLINSLRDTDGYIKDIYLNGGCYQFHLFLKKMFPNCKPMINIEKNHIVTYYKGKYYDITGEVKGSYFILNKKDLEIVSEWSFRKNRALKISECPACDEPIIC